MVGGIVGFRGAGARAVLGVGYPESKHRVLKHAHQCGFEWPALIHPESRRGARVNFGRGCFVQAGCILTCDIDVAEFATINTGATINHDVRIGRLATISPGAHIGGNVIIEEGAFVGIGAAVKQRVRIGMWSVVGAGAVVVSDVPPNTVVTGVPARIREQRESGWHE